MQEDHSEEGTATILVVDDQPISLRLLSEALHGHYRVLTATSGEEGLRVAREQRPDLVLLDIVMPGMDGHALFAALQADERTRDIPVIFVTVRDTDQDQVEGLRAGGVDYITKPFSAQVVLARVGTQLELKRSRDRLALSEARYRALFRYSPLPVLAWRLQDGRPGLADYNLAAERIWEGLEASRGGTPADLRPALPDLDASLLECCRIGQAERRELELTGRDGAPLILVAHFTHVSPDTALTVCEDVSAARRAEELRQEIESIIRHDLKGPISATITALRMLGGAHDLPESQRRLVSLMEHANYGLLDMVNNLLAMRRAEQGSLQSGFDPVDLAAILRGLLRDLAPSLDRAGVVARLRGPDGDLAGDTVVTVPGDASLLQSVFANLVQNALEASRRGDAVTVTLRPDPAGAVVEVHNPAPVPEAMREIFFAKYATYGKPKGTGLGTYAARLYTELHGGAIAMRTAEDAGTTVRVFLPAAPAGRTRGTSGTRQ